MRVPREDHPAWDIFLEGGQFHMTLRDRRGLRAAPDEELLQCGAALENIRLALRHFGLNEQVELAPEGEEASAVARVRVAGARATTLEEELLFQELEPSTSAHRDAGGMSPALIGLLRHAARREGAWLELLGDGPSRFATSPWHAVIGTAGTSRTDWIRAGEALQRVTLHASLQGLQLSVVHAAPPRSSSSPVGQGTVPLPRGETKVVARFDFSARHAHDGAHPPGPSAE